MVKYTFEPYALILWQDENTDSPARSLVMPSGISSSTVKEALKIHNAMSEDV
jgi:hypothetical protein